ncbi:MAG: hypothetical protein WCE35_21100, partial [Bradyrhizobium sp.]
MSALFASILAGASFTAVAENDTKAADNCLAAPKGAVPEGGHWYYRIDRVTKRQCWYIGDERDRPARAATTTSPSPAAAAVANPAPPQPAASVRKSIANARAEFPSPQTSVAPDATVGVAPRSNRAAADNGQRAIAPDASTQTIMSRWPNPAAVNSSNEPRLAAADPPASAPTETEAAPPANIMPLAPAAANSPSQKETGSMQMLLLVLVGALALASLIGSAIFRLGRRRRRSPAYQIRDGRRAIWRTVDTVRRSPPMSPDEEVAVRRPGAPRHRTAGAPMHR